MALGERIWDGHQGRLRPKGDPDHFIHSFIHSKSTSCWFLGCVPGSSQASRRDRDLRSDESCTGGFSGCGHRAGGLGRAGSRGARQGGGQQGGSPSCRAEAERGGPALGLARPRRALPPPCRRRPGPAEPPPSGCCAHVSVELSGMRELPFVSGWRNSHLAPVKFENRTSVP